MNKMSSKLTAGVRKVKTEPKTDEAGNKPAESAPVARPSQNGLQRSGKPSDQHPPRIWPD